MPHCALPLRQVVGKFSAVLERRLTAAEELSTAADSAASGGAPEVLTLVPKLDDRLVYKER